MVVDWCIDRPEYTAQRLKTMTMKKIKEIQCNDKGTPSSHEKVCILWYNISSKRSSAT